MVSSLKLDANKALLLHEAVSEGNEESEELSSILTESDCGSYRDP